MMDPIKVSGVREWKVPTNTMENCTFQGFANFYRCFIPNFSKIARLLNNLLKTGVKWHWGEEQQKAFEEIKRLIMSEPVLHQPDQTKPFKVKVDMSNYAMGTVLMQRDEKNILHLIAFFSKSMNEAQCNCHKPRYWSATDRYRGTCYKGNKCRTRPFGSLQV